MIDICGHGSPVGCGHVPRPVGLPRALRVGRGSRAAPRAPGGRRGDRGCPVVHDLRGGGRVTRGGGDALPLAGRLGRSLRAGARGTAREPRAALHGRLFAVATSLLTLTAGEKLVLPSPNGATLCALAADLGVPVYVACLRNARAVGEHLHGTGSVLVVPAGERWPDGSLRPALEDWLGAGAVIDALGGDSSPEAHAAAQAFRSARTNLNRVIHGCSSGRELIERGFGADVALAAQVEVSSSVPVLRNGAFMEV
ncbi:2-phosphosulfolactate phosphatase [Deinococcus yunweiensis]|uniref:2-phosphosulfolactate phosphatase n=1 Tax=Deinococcus yunweiensis TaxID=367282 RepID=UPI00398EDF8C